MPRVADSSLRKVTLNLRADDCDFLAAHYGQGWSEKVRDVLTRHVAKIKRRDEIDDIFDRTNPDAQ